MFVRLLDSTIVREVAQGAQIVNLETGEDCVVNATGLSFLRVLNGSVQSIDMLAETLHSTTFQEIPINELKKDVIDFLKLLHSNNFVSITEDKKEIDKYALENLHVEITMRCNERCVHCYLPNSIKDEGIQMSYDKFCHIVDEFVALGGQRITISGGEPLLHESIIPMLYYCNTKGLVVDLYSNLVLTNEKLIETLMSVNVGLVQVSVYSLDPKIHDYITGREGSLSKTKAAIEHLVAAKIPIQIVTPVMSQNKDAIPALMEFTKKHEIRLRTNSLIIPQTNGNSSFATTNSLTLKQKECMICSMLKKDADYTKGQLLELKNNSEELYKNPKMFLQVGVCSAGINGCSISPAGDVFPCPEWQSYILGNLSENTLEEIWYNSTSLKLLRQINKQKNYPQCLTCKAIDYCKRCFVANELANKGELLRINNANCEYAFLVKSLVEIKHND